MPKELTMPLLSPSMTEGTIAKWKKKEGDSVKSGEVIAEVETDKATMDLESFETGTLLKILVPAGSSVAINAPIAYVGKPGEKVPDQSTAPKKEESAPAPKAEEKQPEPAVAQQAPATQPSAAVVASYASPSNGNGRVIASPLAKKVAQDLGVNLGGVTGTGPGGRIVRRDVEMAPKGGGFTSKGPIAKDERIMLSNMRKTIAKRLLESKTQIPHFYLEVEVDTAALTKARASLNTELESAGIKLSVNDIILKATTEALRKAPLLNASFQGDAVQQYGAVHMSFAVSIPDGLITPVIRDAHAKSLMQIAKDAKTLIAKAKEGKLTPEDYTGGTFTISNMGMLGIDKFLPIINPPQAAILGVAQTVKKAVVNEAGQIVVGERMVLTLSADHRVVDGADGAKFLNELKRLLENPILLLI
jgi:pyruvate dehydrogenase E2 component (dihydrolipoamide acetyltransferase)